MFFSFYCLTSTRFINSELADPNNSASAKLFDAGNASSNDIVSLGFALQNSNGNDYICQTWIINDASIAAGGVYVVCNNASTFSMLLMLWKQVKVLMVVLADSNGGLYCSDCPDPGSGCSLNCSYTSKKFGVPGSKWAGSGTGQWTVFEWTEVDSNVAQNVEQFVLLLNVYGLVFLEC